MNDIERQISDLPTPLPSASLDERIETLFENAKTATMASMDEQSPSLTWSRRSLMIRGLTIASVCGISVAILAVLVWWNGSGQFAFAQVIESAEDVTTVQYLQTGRILQKPTDPNQLQYTIPRVDIEKRQKELQNQLKDGALTNQQRHEREAELRVLAEFVNDDSRPLLSLAWCRVSGNDKLRTEVVFPAVEVSGAHPVHITNGEKRVTLNHANQTATIQSSIILDSETGEPLEVGPNSFLHLAKVPEENVTRLPERTFNGRTVVGFRQHVPPNESSQTWWVDPETKLPVRVELKNVWETGLITEMTLSDLVYNATLDDELFSVEPPEGYRVEVFSNTFHIEAE